MNFAVIFDMDGVLVDTHPSIVAGHKRVFASHGVTEFNSYFGTALPDKIPRWEKEHGIKLDVEDFRKIGREEWEKAKHTFKAPKELLVFLEDLKKHSVPIAVATVSPRPRTERTLEAIGIERYFEVMVTRDDGIKHRKPAPDIYLKAAEMVSMPPSQCVAIEDSPVGAQSAKNAGMVVIGFSNTYHDPNELKPFCKLVVNNFSELSYQVVKNLLETR